MIVQVILEGLGLGILLILVCAVGIRKGAVGMVHLYSPDAYIPFERLVYEGDVISYTDSSIETVTEVEENGDFYTKITSMPKLPLKNMD